MLPFLLEAGGNAAPFFIFCDFCDTRFYDAIRFAVKTITRAAFLKIELGGDFSPASIKKIEKNENKKKGQHLPPASNKKFHHEKGSISPCL